MNKQLKALNSLPTTERSPLLSKECTIQQMENGAAGSTFHPAGEEREQWQMISVWERLSVTAGRWVCVIGITAAATWTPWNWSETG